MGVPRNIFQKFIHGKSNPGRVLQYDCNHVNFFIFQYESLSYLPRNEGTKTHSVKVPPRKKRHIPINVVNSQIFQYSNLVVLNISIH